MGFTGRGTGTYLVPADQLGVLEDFVLAFRPCLRVAMQEGLGEALAREGESESEGRTERREEPFAAAGGGSRRVREVEKGRS